MHDTARDPYLDPQSGVLRNRAGITDAQALKQHEAMWAGAGSLRWSVKPEAQTYDLAHLQKIHERLYSETYDWAGQVRTIDTERKGLAYSPSSHVAGASKALLSELQAERSGLQKAQADRFSERAGYYMAELTRLQPFREGGLRAHQVFVGQLAREAGYNIEWQKMDRLQMERAQTEAMRGNHSAFQAMLGQHLKLRELDVRVKDGRLDKDVTAVRSIYTDRESLDRMERSYPADHSKQSDIKTARVMLNSLEQAVRQKLPEVALSRDPTAPDRINRDFDRIPAHVSTKEAVVLVKRSIHAVERAGTTVHHEMSEVWKSKQVQELHKVLAHGR